MARACQDHQPHSKSEASLGIPEALGGWGRKEETELSGSFYGDTSGETAERVIAGTGGPESVGVKPQFGVLLSLSGRPQILLFQPWATSDEAHSHYHVTKETDLS